MKLLLDSCVWGKARKELEMAGHDVVWTGDWPKRTLFRSNHYCRFGTIAYSDTVKKAAMNCHTQKVADHGFFLPKQKRSPIYKRPPHRREKGAISRTKSAVAPRPQLNCFVGDRPIAGRTIGANRWQRETTIEPCKRQEQTAGRVVRRRAMRLKHQPG